MESQSQERIEEIEYVRTFACIAIIFIHTIYSAIVLFGEGLSFREMVIYRAGLNNLMWAVPCFFMVTGALLLNPAKEIGYKKLFTKYVARTVKAIFVFGVLFTLLELLVAQEKSLSDFLTGIYEIFSGNSWSHMWYLYSLLGLYLLLPFYKMITSAATEKDIKYLLAVYVLFLSLLPLLKMVGLESGFLIHVSTIYPFWLFFGHYIKCRGLKEKWWIDVCMALIPTILLALLTWIRWKWEVAPLEMLFSYSSILVIIQTTGVFGMFYHIPLKKAPLLKKVVMSIARHSFGIYLLHLIFIRGIYKHLHYNPFVYGGIFGILGVVIVSLVLSWVLDAILRKLPIFRSIL